MPPVSFSFYTFLLFNSKKQRVPSYTDRILYMAHNDFALEHNVQLDEMGRKIPQSTRKKAARGGPSDAVSGTSYGSDSGVLEETPELKLLAYDYLPEYVTSDHRPVFARFEARVPSSWFQLPVRFIQPPMPGRSPYLFHLILQEIWNAFVGRCQCLFSLKVQHSIWTIWCLLTGKCLIYLRGNQYLEYNGLILVSSNLPLCEANAIFHGQPDDNVDQISIATAIMKAHQICKDEDQTWRLESSHSCVEMVWRYFDTGL